MKRTIPIRMNTSSGEHTVQIRPHWAGEGVAIHKPLKFNLQTGEWVFQDVRGYWRLTHIPTGMSLGCCMGSLDRAINAVREWDAEFAALQPGGVMPPDRIAAWARVVEDLRIEPPRAPRNSPLPLHQSIH